MAALTLLHLIADLARAGFIRVVTVLQCQEFDETSMKLRVCDGSRPVTEPRAKGAAQAAQGRAPVLEIFQAKGRYAAVVLVGDSCRFGRCNVPVRAR